MTRNPYYIQKIQYFVFNLFVIVTTINQLNKMMETGHTKATDGFGHIKFTNRLL